MRVERSSSRYEGDHDPYHPRRRLPATSLGEMLIGSTQYLYKRPALIVYPGVTITVIALMVSIVGNALRDALDPRLNG